MQHMKSPATPRALYKYLMRQFDKLPQEQANFYKFQTRQVSLEPRISFQVQWNNFAVVIVVAEL